MTSFIKRINHSRRCRTKYVRNNFEILEKFHFSISIFSHFYFTFISRSQVIFFTCNSWKEWTAFFLYFSLFDCPKPTLAGYCFLGQKWSFLSTSRKMMMWRNAQAWNSGPGRKCTWSSGRSILTILHDDHNVHDNHNDHEYYGDYYNLFTTPFPTFRLGWVE